MVTRSLRKAVWTLILIGTVSLASAQEDACPSLVDQAILQTNAQCASTERNEACYGNTSIDLKARDPRPITFSAPGDKVALQRVSALRTLPLNVDTGEWGIALLRLQANLPNTVPGQNVTFLLMGDVSLTETPTTANRPMQSFYFTTGIGQARCQQANINALVVQSPDHTKVNLTINGAEVVLGSTAVLFASPAKSLDMLLVDGQSDVTAAGVTRSIPAGQMTQLALGGSDGTQVVGAPQPPVSYPPERIAGIPFDLLTSGQNLALGKPVTASGSRPEDPPEHAVDDLITGADNWHYAIGQPLPQWIEVDLLKPSHIGKIRMMTSQWPEPEIHRNVVRIWVGDADHHLTAVATLDVMTRDDEWIEFTPAAPLTGVRYVRIQLLDAYTGGWEEVQVISAGVVAGESCAITALQRANLREGPGTNYRVVSSLSKGETAIATGQAKGNDGLVWWQAANGAWVRSDNVDEAETCQHVSATR